jgi:hypothetical protein
MIGKMIGNLISTYTSDYSTGGITIQEKKSAQGLPWRHLVYLLSEHRGNLAMVIPKRIA